jgi:hypothetical protein
MAHAISLAWIFFEQILSLIGKRCTDLSCHFRFSVLARVRKQITVILLFVKFLAISFLGSKEVDNRSKATSPGGGLCVIAFTYKMYQDS